MDYSRISLSLSQVSMKRLKKSMTTILSNRSKWSMMIYNRHSKDITLSMPVDSQRNLFQLIQIQNFWVIASNKSTSCLDFQATIQHSLIDFNMSRFAVFLGSHSLCSWDNLASIVKLTWRHLPTMTSSNSANSWDSISGWKSWKDSRCRTPSLKSRKVLKKRRSTIHFHIWTISCKKWVRVWRWVLNSSNSSNLIKIDRRHTHLDLNSIQQSLWVLPLEPISFSRSKSTIRLNFNLKLMSILNMRHLNWEHNQICSHGTTQLKLTTLNNFKI